MNANNAKPPIRTEMRDRTLWIWIDREERRNAINKAVISGIASAVKASQDDARVRSVVLTGAAARRFVPALISQEDQIPSRSDLMSR